MKKKSEKTFDILMVCFTYIFCGFAIILYIFISPLIFLHLLYIKLLAKDEIKEGALVFVNKPEDCFLSKFLLKIPVDPKKPIRLPKQLKEVQMKDFSYSAI